MSTTPASVTASVPEGKKLVIVESPAKSKSIAKYLNAVGSGWVVDSSVGHIRDLPKPSDLPADMKKGPFGKFAVDTEHGFTPYYVVHPDKKKKVTELKRELKDAEALYLATDADREGEAIAWHLLDTLKPTVPVYRMTFGEITEEGVRRAHRDREVPVTIKMRVGIDEEHETYLDAARMARDAGIAALALHGRTTRQHYSGQARWDTIKRLKDATDLPVLGNGDIWEASDALDMMRRTGCAGVVIGRGCLGRPWLFRDLAAAFAGEQVATLPRLGEVAAMMYRHAELLSEHMGEERGCKELRKHVSWYLQEHAPDDQFRRTFNAIEDASEQLEALEAYFENLA